MKALTVDPLWAWAILAGYKIVENRTWRTAHRGRIAIHAGQNKSRDAEPLRLFDRLAITPPDEETTNELRGRMLGTIEIVDIVAFDAHLPIADNPFATGPWCWLLKNGVWLESHIAVPGRLGLWEWEPTDAPLTSDPSTLAPHTPCPSQQSLNLSST